MCENKSNLIFCSCSNETPSEKIKREIETFKILNDTTEYHKTYYAWTLSRIIRKYSKQEKRLMLGQIFLPTNRIDEDVTAKFIVQELNATPKFDFEYTPNDGDVLSIMLRYKYVEIKKHPRPSIFNKFMTFVFENNEWYFGYIDNFEYKQKELGSGKVTPNNEK